MKQEPTSSGELVERPPHHTVDAHPPRVFISYRRDDAAGDAGRLHDALSARFGRDSVFMDIVDIPPGADFAEVINQAIGACDVLVTVIGKNWLRLVDAGGRRRLDDRKDLVRLEIQAALEQKIRVIPALVQGAQMPRAEELPKGLAKLAGRNAFEISHARWGQDVGRLIMTIEEPTPRKAAPAHNLPRQLTSFVGRRDDLSAVKRTLSTARLLTLTGPGGCGKTRLALQAAAEVVAGYRDGVWLVDLAPLTDPQLVLSSVMHSLGGREEPGEPLAQTLTAFLRPKQLLLILDSCEHLVATTAWLADSILSQCPDVQILATSREPLHIAGEVAWPVPPLAVATEAVALFADRAQDVRPGFLLQPHRREVEELCRRLDGNPLAIELAAARIRMLSPAEILDRLEDRFLLLTSAPRSAAARHQTLRAAVDWSYDLLGEHERTLFRRLSVFAGGFSLEAAESVCSGGEIESRDLLDLVGRLVQQSLVILQNAAPAPHATRYGLLETLREYSRDKLDEAGEAAAVRRRHAAHFLALAEAAEPKLQGREGVRMLESLDLERDNLRMVFEESAGTDPETELRLAVALFDFWQTLGRYAEGRARLTAALSRTDEPSRLRSKAMRGVAYMAWAQGDHAAATSWCEMSLELSRRLKDREEEGSCLQQLGQIAFQQEDFARARSYLQEGLAVATELRDEHLASICRFRLGMIALFDGDFRTSSELLQASLESGRQAGYDEMVVMSLEVLGHLAIREGRLEDADAFLREGLTIWRERGGPRQIASLLDGFAVLAAAQRDAARALRLAACAEGLRREIAAAPSSAFQRDILERLRPARESLGDDAIAAVDISTPMSREQAVAYALGEQSVWPGERE